MKVQRPDVREQALDKWVCIRREYIHTYMHAYIHIYIYVTRIKSLISCFFVHLVISLLVDLFLCLFADLLLNVFLACLHVFHRLSVGLRFTIIGLIGFRHSGVFGFGFPDCAGLGLLMFQVLPLRV